MLLFVPPYCRCHNDSSFRFPPSWLRVTTSGAVNCGDVTFSVAGSLYQRNIRRWHVKKDNSGAKGLKPDARSRRLASASVRVLKQHLYQQQQQQQPSSVQFFSPSFWLGYHYFFLFFNFISISLCYPPSFHPSFTNSSCYLAPPNSPPC